MQRSFTHQLSSNSVYKDLQCRKVSRHRPRYWDNADNQRNFFDNLGKELGITSHEGWYSIKLSDIKKLGPIQTHHRKSPSRAIMAAYPGENEHHITTLYL